MLKMAARINGVNKLVVNKMDVLEQVGKWRAFNGPHVLEFDSREDIEYWIKSKLQVEVNKEMETFFSGDKEYI